MMSRVSLGVIGVALFSTSIVLAQQNSAGQELVQIEHKFGEAYKQHDTATLGRLLADDFFFTDEDGQVLNKTQYLDRAAHTQLDSYSFDDMRAHVYGETGVVTSRMNGSGTYGGKGTKFDVRYTDVFVKKDGHWQIVVSQDTQRAKK
jgi:ketosteroid isomerase-like protein